VIFTPLESVEWREDFLMSNQEKCSCPIINQLKPSECSKVNERTMKLFKEWFWREVYK